MKGSGRAALPGDSEIDSKLGGALAAFDHATLALQLCRYADSQAERIERARQAREGFEAALLQLEKADAALKAREEWQLWHEEAQGGLDIARGRLALLGA